MPAESIARNLAFMNWTVLAGLAVGSFLAVVVGRFRTAATRGFLGFTSACAGVFALVAFVSDSGLPAPADAHALTDPTWVTARRALLLVLACLAFAYVVAIARNRRAAPLAGAACLAGTGALVVAAVTWAGGFPEAGPFALQLVVLAAATGGVFAAMVLGHWYLVTPRLPNEPLVLFARLLVGLVALQLLLFVTWMATGAGGDRPPFEPLVGEWALFVWFRLLIGLVFPLVVSWAALQTARSRSMESATGLLYIDVGAIAVGTILASGLYFGAGLLV